MSFNEITLARLEKTVCFRSKELPFYRKIYIYIFFSLSVHTFGSLSVRLSKSCMWAQAESSLCLLMFHCKPRREAALLPVLLTNGAFHRARKFLSRLLALSSEAALFSVGILGCTLEHPQVHLLLLLCFNSGITIKGAATRRYVHLFTISNQIKKFSVSYSNS